MINMSQLWPFYFPDYVISWLESIACDKDAILPDALCNTFSPFDLSVLTTTDLQTADESRTKHLLSIEHTKMNHNSLHNRSPRLSAPKFEANLTQQVKFIHAYI